MTRQCQQRLSSILCPGYSTAWPRFTVRGWRWGWHVSCVTMAFQLHTSSWLHDLGRQFLISAAESPASLVWGQSEFVTFNVRTNLKNNVSNGLKRTVINLFYNCSGLNEVFLHRNSAMARAVTSSPQTQSHWMSESMNVGPEWRLRLDRGTFIIQLMEYKNAHCFQAFSNSSGKRVKSKSYQFKK